MEKRTDEDTKIDNDVVVETDDKEISTKESSENAKINDSENEGNQDQQDEEQILETSTSPEPQDTEVIENETTEEATSIWEDKLKTSEEKYLRVLAEFANFKKRIERERVETADYLKGDIIKKMLPVLDDFKLMIEKSTNENNEESVIEGANLIYEKFVQILEKEELTRIDAIGRLFDPQIHEALMMKPIEDETERNKIVEVFQEGYLLREKLLRPSKVVVGTFEKE